MGSNRSSGMGGHQSANMLKDEWLTPPPILAALGPFDLDPCAPITPPWRTATTMLNIHDDGLRTPWPPGAFVWCNPPYGDLSAAWLAKLAAHGNGIALIFARTETVAFHSHVWDRADGVLFLRGRLHFHHVDGTRAKANAGAPSCLVAYGREAVGRLSSTHLPGHFVPITPKEKHHE